MMARKHEPALLGLEYPHITNVTFKRAPKAETPVAEKQLTLTGEAETPRRKKKRR